MRSTTAGEALAFVDGFDAAFALRADMQQALGRDIPIIMLTDSQILFNVLTRKRTTSEKRLMIDLKVARAAYANKEISNVALIGSIHNPADSLTKIRSNGAMQKIMASNRLEHPISQFVIEPHQPSAENATDDNFGVH